MTQAEEKLQQYRAMLAATTVKAQCCYGKFALPPELSGRNWTDLGASCFTEVRQCQPSCTRVGP